MLEVGESTTFESSIIRARPNRASANSLYLYYFFNSPLGLQYLASIRRQVAVAGITGSDLARLEIPILPLDYQKAIAHILGTLDDKIELNRRMSETLEDIARALFKSWFVDFDPVWAKMEGRWKQGESLPGMPAHLWELFPDKFVDSELGEIPEGWEEALLSDLSTLNPESWSKSNIPDTLNYIDLTNTKWGRIDSVMEYSKVNAPSRARRVLQQGDTIVGTVRPGNGSYALITDKGLTGSTGFAVLCPKEREYTEFVYLAATAKENIDRLAHIADGAAYPAVRPHVVASTRVTIPSDNVLSCFSSITGTVLARVASNEAESNTLNQLRDTLLPKLISGELRVSDAEHYMERTAQ